MYKVNFIMKMLLGIGKNITGLERMSVLAKEEHLWILSLLTSLKKGKTLPWFLEDKFTLVG